MSSASEMTAPGPVGSNASDIENSLASTYIVNGRILVVAVVILFGVVLFILCIHIYAKWYWRTQENTTYETRNVQGVRTQSFSWTRRRVRQMNFLGGESNLAHATQLLEGLGLDMAVVELLPTFVYCREGTVLFCAVCLEEFEDKETGRLLPRCNHSFHLDCIDMWFHSHSTCPLCRTSVKPDKAHQWLESNPSSPHQQFLVEATLGSTTDFEAGSFLSSIRSSGTRLSAQPGSTQNQAQNQSLEEVADDGVDLDRLLEDQLQEAQQQAPTSSSRPLKSQEQNVSNCVVPASIPPYVLFWGKYSHHENAQSPTGNSALEPQHEQRRLHAGSGLGQAFSVAIDMPTWPISPVAVAEAEAGPSSRSHMVQLQELSLKLLLSRGNIVATVTAPYNSSTELLEQGAGPSSSTISEPQ